MERASIFFTSGQITLTVKNIQCRVPPAGTCIVPFAEFHNLATGLVVNMSEAHRDDYRAPYAKARPLPKKEVRASCGSIANPRWK